MRAVAEKKYFDSAFILTPQTAFNNGVPLEGSLCALTEVPQGVADTQRIGDKTTGTSIEINYITFPIIPGTPGVGAAYKPNLIWILRCIIFIWKDDTTPTTDDITDISTIISAGISVPITPLDHDRKVKRKILYDKIHTMVLDMQTGLFAGMCAVPVTTKRFAIPLHKIRGNLGTINYQGGSATGVNKIYMLLISNIPRSSTGVLAWNTEVYTRYNFIDM